VTRSCEHKNELSCSIIDRKFLDFLKDYLASQNGFFSMDLIIPSALQVL
jgi:hypothetical protein